MLGVPKWEHWDGETYKSSTAYNESILIPRIQRVLDERDWEKVVTHNQGGEYGHYRHVGTHNVMSRLCPEKLWVFDTCSDHPLSDEIKELVTFYHTDLGKKLAEKQLRSAIARSAVEKTWMSNIVAVAGRLPGRG